MAAANEMAFAPNELSTTAPPIRPPSALAILKAEMLAVAASSGAAFPHFMSTAARLRLCVRRLWPIQLRVAAARVLTERIGDGGGTPIGERAGNRSLVLFDSGDEVTVQAGEEGMRFLLVSGKPIEEQVAWYGPIVVSTDAELEQAYAELRSGTFIKQRDL